MKKHFLFLFLFCVAAVIYSHAQVAINEDSSTADPSAILELKSSSKGLLLPRMKDISTNPITNPKAGLLVYDSATKATWIYDGSSWIKQGTLKLPYSDSIQSNSASAFAVKNIATSSFVPAISGISSTGATYDALLGFPTGNIITGATAVQGELTSPVGGSLAAAVRGINRDTTNDIFYIVGSPHYNPGSGILGYHAGGGAGVFGYAEHGSGVYGRSPSGNGLYGESSSGNALKTNGKVQFSGIGEGTGKVLTSDDDGNATWQTPQAGGKIGFSSTLFGIVDVNAKSDVTLYKYSTPSFNDGNGFNETDGVFTAPVSGVYHFDVKIDFANPDGNNDLSEYSIGLNGEKGELTFTSTVIALPSNYVTSLVLTCNAALQAGDEVNVSFYNSSAKKIQIYSYGDGTGTFFSGYKVY